MEEKEIDASWHEKQIESAWGWEPEPEEKEYYAPAQLGKCRALTPYEVLVEAYRLNPRVVDPVKMAHRAENTCKSFAHDKNGHYHWDDFEEHMSVVIVAAIANKGMTPKQAILDYRSGRYSGPDGYYVFGIARNATLMGSKNDDGDDMTLELGDRELIRDFTQAQVPSGLRTTNDEEMDPAELREFLAMYVAAVIDMQLNQLATEEPEKVKAFRAVYMGSCFPGAKANWGMSQREQAEELGIDDQTMIRWADEVCNRLAEHIGAPKDKPKRKLRHSIQGTGGKAIASRYDPRQLAGVTGKGGYAHICDLGKNCGLHHNPVTCTNRNPEK